MLVLDPKSLLTKYNIDLGDIQRISVSPLKDGVIVFHIRTVDVHLSVLFFGTNQYLSRRAGGGGVGYFEDHIIFRGTEGNQLSLTERKGPTIEN